MNSKNAINGIISKSSSFIGVGYIAFTFIAVNRNIKIIKVFIINKLNS
jgi:hypothetical protein